MLMYYISYFKLIKQCEYLALQQGFAALQLFKTAIQKIIREKICMKYTRKDSSNYVEVKIRKTTTWNPTRKYLGFKEERIDILLIRHLPPCF